MAGSLLKVHFMCSLHTLPPGAVSSGGAVHSPACSTLKKVALLLASMLPVAVLANPVLAEESHVPKVEVRTAGQRWEDADKAEAPSFRRHVIPLMSRLGCSGRECHGSFSGRGGFQLSLFGYDFDKDHQAITEGKGGEDEVRVNLKEAVKSLVLTKPSLDGEEHKGKKRFEKGSWEYNLILRWIQDGAKNDTVATGEFDRLEVTPPEIVFSRPGETMQISVLAHWKDGTVEDVTQISRFRSNDESVANISEKGVVTSAGKGDTHVVAFYDNGVLPIPVMAPVSDQVGARYPEVATRTKVDELVVGKLRKLGIVPSGQCSDTEFLRRVSLDLTATLPTPDEVTKFVADKSSSKRAAKIEELLKTPGYAAWWTTKFCDITGNNPRRLNLGSPDVSSQWYGWIYRRIADNEPYDKLAAGIILATGRTQPDQSYEDFALEMGSYFRKDHPADFTARPNMPYFWSRDNVRKAEEKALAFAHTFLGVRIECAQCHKHPFDQWTKTDFQQFQAFFDPVRYAIRDDDPGQKVTFTTVEKEIREIAARKMAEAPDDPKATNSKNPAYDLQQKEYKIRQSEVARRQDTGELLPWRELFVFNVAKKNNGNKKKNDDYSGRVITPKLLGGDEIHLTNYSDPRDPLMTWLKGKDNPYFARALVNRIWANYFNRGIVEPTDDMNLANPPVNEALMDYLANGFVAHGYDMKWLHREILNSDTYQRSWNPNETNELDEKNFSRAVLRRLPAEVVLDAITQATVSSGMLAKFSGEIATRAIGPGEGVNGESGYTLAVFGRPAREVNCDCERTTDATLLQTIFTRNDPELLARIDRARSGRPAWIEELRRTSGKAPQNLPIAETRKRLEALQQKLASLKPPEKPDTVSVDARNRYENGLRTYNAQRSNLEKSKAELEAALPGATPRLPLDVDKTIAEVFLRTVSRPPTPEEREDARKDIAAASDPVDAVRDLLWALLNTREFMVNH